MTSPYRPTLATGMTGSSVAHGFAGGTPLPAAPAGLNEKFETPGSHGTVTKMGHAKVGSVGTHSYAQGTSFGGHVVHPPRGL